MWKRGRCLAGLVASLLMTSSLGGCLTLAAIQRANEEREVSQRLHAGAVEQSWFEREGFPLSGNVEVKTPTIVATPDGSRPVEPETLTCEGLSARLIPDTPHHRWVLEHRFGFALEPGGEWRSGVPGLHRWAWPESPAYVQDVECGSGGVFSFPKIPDGRYFFMAGLNSPSYDSASRVDFVLKPVVVSGGRRRPQLIVVMEYGAVSRPSKK